LFIAPLVRPGQTYHCHGRANPGTLWEYHKEQAWPLRCLMLTRLRAHLALGQDKRPENLSGERPAGERGGERVRRGARASLGPASVS